MYQSASISWEEMEERKRILLLTLSELSSHWDKAEFFIELMRRNLMTAEHMATLASLIDDAVKNVKDAATINAFATLKEQVLSMKERESKEKETELSDMESFLNSSL